MPHNFNWMMLQATIAILLLVGFESVTSLGEEAKNPKKDIPRGVLLSLTIQGLFCYLIEYFAANYFMNSAYSLADAKGSAAPIGDMMVIIGNALLGGHGQAFMLIEAFTVFLALIGTTLSLHQHRRARDLRDGPRRGGAGALRHAARREPDAASRDLDAGDDLGGARRIRRAVLLRRRLGARRQDDRDPAAQHLVRDRHEFQRVAVRAAERLALVTLVSNFGTFMLYGLTNIICIVAFREHHEFHGFKHMVVPVFGALANFACMAFYIIGPIEGLGSVKGAADGGGSRGDLGRLWSDLLHAQFAPSGQGDCSHGQTGLSGEGTTSDIRRAPGRAKRGPGARHIAAHCIALHIADQRSGRCRPAGQHRSRGLRGNDRKH